MSKPIIVGLDNPHSDDPEHALYPYPVGCTGWRLWQMLAAVTGATRTQYLRAFTRLNLRDSSGQVAYVPEEWTASTVILLGDEVRRHLQLPKVLIHPILRGSRTFRQIPHPSGRNLFYNDPVQRALVGQLLADLYYRRGHEP